MRDNFTLSGPDFLDQVAEAEQAGGLNINAAEYSKRAREWREDLQSGSVARDANDLLSRELIKLRQGAAEAYDSISRVRPHSENLDEYNAARASLAAIADFPLGAAAWSPAVSQDRDPRQQPMPGDRFYLPVEVLFANYAPGNDLTTTLVAVIAGQPLESSFHNYPIERAWLQGAIGIVPAATLPIPAAAAA